MGDVNHESSLLGFPLIAGHRCGQSQILMTIMSIMDI